MIPQLPLRYILVAQEGTHLATIAQPHVNLHWFHSLEPPGGTNKFVLIPQAFENRESGIHPAFLAIASRSYTIKNVRA